MKRSSLKIVIVLVALCVPISPSQGQSMPGAAPGGAAWIYLDSLRGPPSVSVGDEGGQIFAHFPAPCCDTRSEVALFSAWETQSAPVWTRLTRHYQPGSVASAMRKDLHVSAARQDPDLADPGPVRVLCWGSSSNEPRWVYVHPTLSPRDPWVGISEDGSLVVAVIARPGPSGEVDVIALDGTSGAVLTQTVVAPTLPSATMFGHALSDDGRYAALRVGTQAFVVDVLAASISLQLDGFQAIGGADSFSADGRVLALSDPWIGEVRILERTGSTWQDAYTWTGAAVSIFSEVEVSPDGSTVAASFGGFPPPGNAILSVAIDVASRTQTMFHVAIVCCDQGYGPVDLDITPDGSRFVVAVEGGIDLDPTERVLLYARDQDDPLATWIADSALVTDIALSPDGRLIALGSGDPFALDDTGGWLSLFTYPGADFRVIGAPQLGAEIELVLDGTPGESGLLLLAFAPATPPLVLPGTGTLFLDPTGLRTLPMGLVSMTESAQLTLSVPNLPAFLGVPVWAQGLRMPSLTLSESWHKLTLLP